MGAGCSGVAQLAAIILAAAGHAQAQAEQAKRAEPLRLQTGNPVIDHIGPDIIGDGGAR